MRKGGDTINGGGGGGGNEEKDDDSTKLDIYTLNVTMKLVPKLYEDLTWHRFMTIKVRVGEIKRHE